MADPMSQHGAALFPDVDFGGDVRGPILAGMLFAGWLVMSVAFVLLIVLATE